ncbi:MAG: hypothetical protein PHQ43_01330 [Dehalococcoidales bacterium]|nr:hypothetical protein [Dehalococcoidales bacterium]
MKELYASSHEQQIRSDFVKTFRECPIPDEEVMQNLGLFLNSKNLSRILYLDYLYRQILDLQGIIMDLGTRWGQNMSVFAALRGIYEPFNRHRKIVGFDTFSGPPSIGDNDTNIFKREDFATVEDYPKYLAKIMEYQEQDNPISHVRKYEIHVGDVIDKPQQFTSPIPGTVNTYLHQHPETIIALAYFDFDMYEPTRKCLDYIKPYLMSGSILAFDELNDRDSPGETTALKKAFNIDKIRIKRYRYASRVSYFILE